MFGPQFESEQVDPIMAQIYEGMKVQGPEGHIMGTVEYVYLGEVAEASESSGCYERPPSVLSSTEGSFIEEFATAILLTEQLSDSWRERLLSYGFIRINGSGLFARHYYAMPSQIAGVVDGQVLLYVRQEELLQV